MADPMQVDSSISASSSSLGGEGKLDLSQEQRNALIDMAEDFFGVIPIPDFRFGDWVQVFSWFLPSLEEALKSMDLGFKIAQPSRVDELLRGSGGQLKSAFQKGVEEKDWMDLVGLCMCHLTPDAPVHRI
jgi:hypothetical protein